ncbi:MAG TPA: cytidylate kinase-like family protein [Chitinivibrionales bacterium]
MTTIASVERFLEVQVQEWGRRSEKQKSPAHGPVITVSREAGCDADAIAKILAKKFDLVLYDWKIVEEIAKASHVSEQAVATLDENIAYELSEWLTGLSAGPSFSTTQYMQSLRKVLFTVAAHGNAIIVGRGANFLLPPDKITIGIRFVASLTARAKNIMRELGLSEESALAQIKQTDNEQRQWVKKHAGADINDAGHYHLNINIALIAPDKIVQIVKDILDN